MGHGYFDKRGEVVPDKDAGEFKLLVHWRNSGTEEDEYFPVLALLGESSYKKKLVEAYVLDDHRKGGWIELRKVLDPAERKALVAINPAIPETIPEDATIVVATGPGWTTRRNQSEQVESVGAWQAYKDPESGTQFYYNHDTHVSQWEIPEGWVEAHQGNNDDDLAQDSAATRNSGGIRRSTHKAAWDDVLKHSSPTKKRRDGDWQHMVDDDTGETFYHNTRTGMSQWHDPAVVGERPEDDPAHRTEEGAEVVSIGPGLNSSCSDCADVAY